MFSEELISNVEKWFKELTELSLTEVPRCLHLSDGEAGINMGVVYRPPDSNGLVILSSGSKISRRPASNKLSWVTSTEIN